MMTTPKTPIRAKVQRELSTLASEAHAIGLQQSQLLGQLEANHERTAKLNDFLQTLAEFEAQEPLSGRRPGLEAAAMGLGGGATAPAFAPSAAAVPTPLAVPVSLADATVAGSATPGPAGAATAGTSPEIIKEFVAHELAQLGELSTRDLVERIKRQGYAIAGREPLGDLSVILSGSAAFRNENRLWYLVNKSLPGRPLDLGAGRTPGSAPVFGSSGLPGPTTP